MSCNPRGGARWLASLVVAVTLLASASGAQAAFPEQPVGSALARYWEHPSGNTALLSPPSLRWPASEPPHWANGSSDHLVFSQDNRVARLLAFDSDAASLVPGIATRGRQVFVVRRGSGGANLAGRLLLASGVRGTSGNGASSDPSLDGSTHARPHCVAFASRATNFDPADGSPDADIYLRDLRRDRPSLITAGVRGDAREPVVDGRCQAVLFAAAGQVWFGRFGHRPLWVAAGSDPDLQTDGRGAAYVRRGQVWYRTLAMTGGRLRLGVERLASADYRGRAGDGLSGEPALDDVGNYVAFTSSATNLCARRCARVGADRNGAVRDVFRRTLSHRAPTHDVMEMVSSASQPLNADSEAPQISAAGENIIFTTDATNLRRASPGYGVPNPSRAVMSWSFPRTRGYGSARIVTRPGCYQVCMGAQSNPSLSSRGNYIGYTSVTAEFCVDGRPGFAGERPCPDTTDVFIHYMGPSPNGEPLG